MSSPKALSEQRAGSSEAGEASQDPSPSRPGSDARDGAALGCWAWGRPCLVTEAVRVPSLVEGGCGLRGVGLAPFEEEHPVPAPLPPAQV